MKYLFLIIVVILLTSCSKIDVPECDSIADVGKRDVCYNNLGIERLNFKICDKIKNDEKREWCISVVERGLGPRKKGWFG